MGEGGGAIIRLIDVVLNLLFGFIVITDFSLKTQIKLDSGNAGESQVETRVYSVQVLQDGTFQVQTNFSQSILFFSTPQTMALADLESYLVQEFQTNTRSQIKMIVVIRSDSETKIQYSVDVLDLCEKHKITKSFSY